ncbi:hypothetical protein FRC01_014226, partial [Tulasnella sp. 417]
MAVIVEDFHLRIDAGVKGAQADFDEFIEKKKAEAAEQVESGQELRDWAKEASKMRGVTNDQLRKQRRDAMVAKLVELGHDSRDVQRASDPWRYAESSVFDSTAQLSEAVWKRVKAKAEIAVEMAKQSRLDIEHRARRDARKTVARTRYAAFKATYDSSPDRFMLHEGAFFNIPAIRSVIQNEGDDVSPSMFDDAFDGLPAFFDEWRKERRIELAKILLDSTNSPEDPVAAEKEGILLLATSVFTTCTRWSRFDPEDSTHWMGTMHAHLSEPGRYHPCLGNHKLTFEPMRCIQAVPQSSARARQLVEAAGLDPNTATLLDMDKADARFWCKDCSLEKNRGQAFARTWRNC